MIEITTDEMHTGGEPVRIVTGGLPPIEGRTILDKRRYTRDHLDRYRRLLMHEPRGHRDMYGAIPVTPDHPKADLAVLFIHNEGYSTMCGHAVIALARWAIERGLVKAGTERTAVAIQCPCGLVRTEVAMENGRPGAVSFESVPAFASHLGKLVETRDWGPVTLDIGYGGAFYAVLAAGEIGLDIGTSPVARLTDAGETISRAATALPLRHPDEEDLGFLYGTILTDGTDGAGPDPSCNICVFAGRQVDRSPTGSGVTARIALAFARREIGLGEVRRFRSVTGAIFEGEAVRETRAGPHRAVVVRVAGRAHHSGTARFVVEPDDPLGDGFLLD
ncbi:proline racemase family protein [Oceanibacterium hippocampi]|uniref:Proline racemase n=1 Tax=Oceanibacterium hippocampi TaxID=745714 RepID=A0A1Y5S6S0_9PROT|nr:proline racemase family protein [Oceanibacterium hippocampi]SLN32492.1 Proline racemase [Oceanibacterium hippocampi]